jgi:hypothetical protein
MTLKTKFIHLSKNLQIFSLYFNELLSDQHIYNLVWRKDTQYKDTQCNESFPVLLSVNLPTWLTFVHAMQNGWNWRQLLLRPLQKFADKVWKIFLTQPFSLGQILFHFARSWRKSFALHEYCSYLLLSILLCAECQKSECCYAECLYTECCGTKNSR